MNKKISLSISAILLALPAIVLAQTLQSTVGLIVNVLLQILWLIAIAFVIIMFVLAGFKYLTAQGDASKVAEANKAVIWGVAGVLIVLIAWSIISLVGTQLGI